MARTDTALTPAYPAPPEAGDDLARDPFLVALGERVRSLRARQGMTRRALAVASSVSERHLANLELGVGNASVLVLRQVAQALGGQVAELVGDDDPASAEWPPIRDLLRGRDDDDLRRARVALADLFGEPARPEARRARIALVGLRGAGKSTLGRRLADHLGLPFVELAHEIERLAGCGLPDLHHLLGPAGYRRCARRALDEVLRHGQAAVIATPGDLVAEPAIYRRLLAQCWTVWLRAAPEDHLRRVITLDDPRPAADRREALDDLARLLDERAACYGQADAALDTGGRDEAQALEALCALVAARHVD